MHACAEYAKKLSPEELKEKLRLDIDDVARLKALQGCEIPREFIVEMNPFSKENHLLTDSGKLATGRLKKRCAHQIVRPWGPNPVLTLELLSAQSRSKKRHASARYTAYTYTDRRSRSHYCYAPGFIFG